MPRRLVVFFDGTWNRVRTHTNVCRLWKLIDGVDSTGAAQVSRYIAGVGVKPGIEHWLGGAFGLGLSDNVREGHRWLSEKWRDGDETWLFGFSRGAYTARSLGGLIRKCGLLKPDAQGAVAGPVADAAYGLYRNDLDPDDPRVKDFRAAHSREVGIRFIGVWDTVGSLGVPGVASWFPFASSRYRFHDTDLSKIVQYAYHALALDEHRADFEPTKWERDPDDLAPGESQTARKPEQLDVEQRWFVGAHADVGGGEKADGAGRSPDMLPELALAWLQAKAAAAGLAFKDTFVPAANAVLAVPNDSYGAFMHGVYRVFNKPCERPIGGGVNETIDGSVWKKWNENADYRPPSLRAALQSGRISIGCGAVR